ncbi:MAG TPA: molecular chaperone TorD family protein [Symbiobacteriaceae bacterium]
MATNAEALIQTEELTAALEARAFAYHLLMQAFLAEPGRDLVRALAESDALRVFPFGEESALIAQGADEVLGYLGDPGNATDEAFDQLKWDYTRLFIGPDRLPAPPYESAYRSEDRLLFQPETLAVRQAYLAYGFAPRYLGSEPDDHIGLELNFLSETCRLAVDHAGAGEGAALVAVLRDQTSFLDEHVLKWAQAFAADTAAGANTAFYRGMAHLLAGFLSVDRRILAELLQDAA